MSSFSRIKLTLFRARPGAPVTPAPGTAQRYTDAAKDASEATALLAERQAVIDYTAANEWLGYTGQARATDNAVSSLAALKLELAAVAAAKTGSSWHRIRLQDGTVAGWQDGIGSETNPIYQDPVNLALDMGSGGLIIEPDAGHDPQLDFGFVIDNGTSCARNVHVRGCRFVTRNTRNADGTGALRYPTGSIGSQDPGYTSVRARLPIVRIENNRFGRLYVAGETVANYKQWVTAIWCQRAEQLIVRGNEFRGVNGAVRHYCCKLAIIEDNDVRDFVGDVLQGQIQSTLTGWNSSVFGGDGTCYLSIRGNLACRQAQVTNLTDPAADIGHVDFYQNSNNVGIDASKSLKRHIEDNVGVFLDKTEKFSTFAGDPKWRSTSGSFVQDNTDEVIQSVIGFNVMLCGINGMNVGTSGAGKHYIIQNVVVGPPDRPLNTDDNNLLNPRVQHYSNPGGQTIMRRNVFGLPTSTPNGVTGLDETGTQTARFNVDGEMAGIFAGTFVFTTNGASRSVAKWTLDESATKSAVMAAVRSQFLPKAGGSAYGWRA